MFPFPRCLSALQQIINNACMGVRGELHTLLRRCRRQLFIVLMMSGRDRWTPQRICPTQKRATECYRAALCRTSLRRHQFNLLSLYLCRLICVSFISYFAASFLSFHYIKHLQAIYPVRMLYRVRHKRITAVGWAGPTFTLVSRYRFWYDSDVTTVCGIDLDRSSVCVYSHMRL